MKTNQTTLNSVTTPFIEKGFTTRRAFINVVLDIDYTISIWDLEFAWDFGVCTIPLKMRLDAVLETLKNE